MEASARDEGMINTFISTVKKTRRRSQLLQHGGHIEEDNSGTSPTPSPTPSPSPSEDNCFIKMVKEHCGLVALAIVTATAILILITGLFGLLLYNRYATSLPLTTEQSSNNQSWDFGVTFGELKISSTIKNAGTITIIFALVLAFFIAGYIAYLYFEKQKIKQS